MSSNSNSSAGGSSKPYIVTGSGTNSQGNHWCNRESSAGSGYHYSNRDGSYYYSNPDGSTYYNDGKGSSTYTTPSGHQVKK